MRVSPKTNSPSPAQRSLPLTARKAISSQPGATQHGGYSSLMTLECVSLCGFLTLLGQLLLRAQSGIPLWTNHFDGPDNTDNQAVTIMLDTNGFAYVSGYSTNSTGALDLATVKYG